ncbi:Procollagen-lysine 2-oxoglutarate 5-dioxygenase [Fasciola hepatica]|uniref:Procollagen-lysine 2-oxoglutarate 5-dioxygenase n=1 Tax=Fasciola hepatica TaxID=6192 RepID=A0A4E0R9S3_FASHE|nr:Procollagen-lysine 2-oxoglutarate 5-dioxygenase [Fasciola hepatica]
MRSCVLLAVFLAVFVKAQEKELLVITVATERNDAFERFMRSAEIYGYDVKVLGMGSTWRGGDVAKSVGGGQKVRLLKEELEDKRNGDLLILFVDSYDVLFLDTKEALLKAYGDFGAKVVFGAEDFCWPQQSLADVYPTVKPGQKRFLNSGAFMGPASLLYEIVSALEIKDEDDDQLYYTKLFLNSDMRKSLGMVLDHSATIIQNLNGALNEVEVRFTEETGYLYNIKTNTKPIIVHGNGPIKVEFNSLGNYLAHSWTPSKGCQHCEETEIQMEKPKDYPVVQLSFFVESPTPFLDVFFERIAELNYPKNMIHVTAHVGKPASSQKEIAKNFTDKYSSEYRSVTWLESTEDESEGSARYRAMGTCVDEQECQFMLSIEGIVQLTNPDTLEHLVRTNRSIVAPMVTRREKLWSNFWGALSTAGYYTRSDDYVEIVEGTKKGIWNVPFTRDVYLLSRNAMHALMDKRLASAKEVDMEICRIAREKNVFMMVDNRHSFGYLINAETYSTEHLHNDLWQVFDNPLDWEEQYIHEEYHNVVAPSVSMTDIEQPCPDVFWFPMVTEKFCRQLIEEMEHYGQWSDGKNNDPRLEGGYENVPTRDIHMRQVGWEEHWLHILRKYVHPMQTKLFQGYDDKPWARMNFVVRYRPDEQPSLRPHHDASSYTLNIALNRPGIDYQGGGTRFTRYNCSLIQVKVGWVATFPGRVTHLHEGLETTKGTRYIFVTFVNP